MTAIDTSEFRDAPRRGASAPLEGGRVPPRREPGHHRGRARRDRERRHRQPPRGHGDGDVRPRARRGARRGRSADAVGDRRRARPDRRRNVWLLRGVRQADRRGPAPRDPVGAPLHRRPAPGRLNDVRVGSSTNGLAPVSVAERSLAAGPWQWAGLARGRARGGRRRPGDEARRDADAAARQLRARGRAALDPPRPELGHRLRALLQRDRDRHGDHRRSPSSGWSSSSRGRAHATRCSRRRSGC